MLEISQKAPPIANTNHPVTDLVPIMIFQFFWISYLAGFDSIHKALMEKERWDVIVFEFDLVPPPSQLIILAFSFLNFVQITRGVTVFGGALPHSE